MKTLSLLQPWASLVIMGLKHIETRSWQTHCRGRVLIHASLTPVKAQKGQEELYEHLVATDFFDNYKAWNYGHIIGSVEIVDCIRTSWCIAGEKIFFPSRPEDTWNITNQELAFGNYNSGRWAWLLKNPIVFEKPIPAKGKLSLWTPNEETISLINKIIH